MPADLPIVLVPQLKSYLSTSDISLLSQSLSILALLLQSSPKVTFPEVEREVLKDIYAIARSPLLSGATLDALLSFFSALVEADSQIAVHVLPSLVSSVDSAPKSEVSLPNVAKCVAQVVKSAHGVAAGAIAEFSRYIKVQSTLFLSIWCVTHTAYRVRRRQHHRALYSVSSSLEKWADLCMCIFDSLFSENS